MGKDGISVDNDEHYHVEKDAPDTNSQIGDDELMNALSSLESSNLDRRLQSDTVRSRYGVVTSDDRRCSIVGVKMLKRGGHAVDAAIATALSLGVVSPTESGIGGGAFMIGVGAFMVVRSASFVPEAYDMKETAPAAAFENMYEDDPDAQIEGPLSIAVLGELAGLHKAWEKYGRLPWKSLFVHAIHYAKNGFQVFPYLAKDLAEFKDKILADPGLREVFAPDGKDVLKAGDICYNKKLGETLEAVAKHGPQAIYNGSIGQNLVKDVRNMGGILTMKDLNDYKAKVTNVVEANLFGYKILGMPPPSAGTVGLTMVGHILENYGSSEALEGSLGLHRLTEALKHMLGMKMNLGDPDYCPEVDQYAALMMSQEFAKKIWAKIHDTKTFLPGHYENRWKQVKDNGTSHLGVIDTKRNAVALTSSINDQFGSKILSPSTGIVLNNQMRDFSTPAEEHAYALQRVKDISLFPDRNLPKHLPPATSNLIEPGKRPLSSMTPLIILKDGSLAGVIGGSGGPNIIAAVAQVFIDHFVLGMKPRPSVHRPRIYPKLLNTDLDYEDLVAIDKEHLKLSDDDIKFLEARGHKMTVVGFPASCHLTVQDEGISVERHGLTKVPRRSVGILTALGDPRKDAKPAGMRRPVIPHTHSDT